MTTQSNVQGATPSGDDVPAPVRGALAAALRRSRAAGGAPQYVVQLVDGRVGTAPRDRQEVLVALGHGVVLAEVRAAPGIRLDPSELTFPPHVSDEDAARLRDRVSDPGWAAALYILTFGPIAAKEGVWHHVYAGCIDWEAILGGRIYLSGGEERMLRIAAACFNSDRPVPLGAVLQGLSVEWVERALQAIRLAAGD